MIKRFASVLITGRFLETAPCNIEELKKRIEETLRKRSATVVRWRALLDRTHFSRADLFLSSEFEIIPVEVEDMELAFFAALSLTEIDRPNEIVFGFGDSGSFRLLKRLAGRVTRTALTFGPDTVPCDEFIDCSTSASSVGEPEEETSLESTPAPQETSVSFDLSTDAWKAALVQLVDENKGVCPAARAIERMKADYPVLLTLFQTDKTAVRAAIPDTLRWIEENGVPILYRADHPNLQPISAEEAVTRLTFNAASEPKKEEPEASDTVRQPAANFADVATRAAICAEQSQWGNDRAKLVSSGASYQDVIQPRDRELDEKAKENSIYLWMRRHEFEPAQWETLAESYRTLERGARLMQTALDAKLSKVLLEKVAKVLARSICLFKSTILSLGFDFCVDVVQRDAYELTIAFAKENNVFLPHLQRTDTCELSEREPINAAIDKLSTELKEQTVSAKKLRQTEQRVGYHLKKIEKNGSNSENDWNKVITGVTALCDEFHVPTNAPSLRKMLSEYIAKIPETTEITPMFADVIQEIDLFEEQQAALFVPDDEKKVPKYSPAVKKVRKIYGGSTVVWVGGHPADHLKQRIENRFNVTLSWESYNHGDSFDRFTSVLNNPEVKLFLVYIPWCSHKHSEDLAQIAKSAGKDFVRLPKGTNPDHIAAVICQQTKG